MPMLGVLVSEGQMRVAWITCLVPLLTMVAACSTGFYTLLGAVEKPGHYSLETGAALNQILDNQQVVQQPSSRVLVWREFDGGGHTAWSKASQVCPNVQVTLGDGDLVVVSALATNTPGLEASILGEVKEQGKFLLNPGASLLDLVVWAGGPTSRADLQDCALLRDETKIPINLAPQNVLTLSRLKIRKGDIFLVGRGMRIAVGGEVRQRDIFTVSRVSPDPLGELLESAGAKQCAALHRLQILRPTLARPILVNLGHG